MNLLRECDFMKRTTILKIQQYFHLKLPENDESTIVHTYFDILNENFKSYIRRENNGSYNGDTARNSIYMENLYKLRSAVIRNEHLITFEAYQGAKFTITNFTT